MVFTIESARLVMESRGPAPQLRSAPHNESWSKLYRSDSHMIDMSCKEEAGKLFLQGQVLLLDGSDVGQAGHIALSGNAVDDTAFNSQGEFSLTVEQQGDYELEASFGDTIIHISELILD